MSLQTTFGDRIRELRTARGWSQEHFADVCGLYRSHMGEIERGEVDVALSTLAKLAKGLDMTAGAILKGII
ncbi:MAG TPA: helix-turn-helix transcriptional regulator [Candidatus Angelobacter sp.]|jgi:transcriptional regulator with XRE-family HTH domain|nr:helix-turn-helix transcriptional regulator [Candidatus Angelobacter sp.]